MSELEAMRVRFLALAATGARWHAAHVRLGLLGLGAVPYGSPDSWNWPSTKLSLAYALDGWIVKPRAPRPVLADCISTELPAFAGVDRNEPVRPL